MRPGYLTMADSRTLAGGFAVLVWWTREAQAHFNVGCRPGRRFLVSSARRCVDVVLGGAVDAVPRIMELEPAASS